LVLFGMYVLGLLAALGSAWLLKWWLKSNYKRFLVLEMPTYRFPVLRNVGFHVWEKTMGFVWGAGKIILAISIVLWVLGSFGVSDRFTNAEQLAQVEHPNMSAEELENEVQSQKLEFSFLGTLGRA